MQGFTPQEQAQLKAAGHQENSSVQGFSPEEQKQLQEARASTAPSRHQIHSGFLGGLVSPFVDIAHQLHQQGQRHSLIPPELQPQINIPSSQQLIAPEARHGVGHFLGGLAGYALPWGAAEKGITAAVPWGMKLEGAAEKAAPFLEGLAKKGLKGKIGAAVAKQGLTGGLVGAATTGTPTGAEEGAIGGGIGAGVLSGAGEGLGSLGGTPKVGASIKATKYATRNAAQKLAEYLHRGTRSENSNITDIMMKNYAKSQNEVGKAYDKFGDLADTTQFPLDFTERNQDIQSAIDDIKSKTRGQEEAKQQQSNALDVLQRQIDPKRTPLQTISDLHTANQANNSGYKGVMNSFKPEDLAEAHSRNIIRKANERVLKDNLMNNKLNEKDKASVGYAYDALRDANHKYILHKNKFDTYVTPINKKGRPTSYTDLGGQFRKEQNVASIENKYMAAGDAPIKNGTINRESIVKGFIPKVTGESAKYPQIGRMKQYADVIGNEGIAKQNIKRNIFAKVLNPEKPEDINFKKAINVYKGLHPVDRKYIFTQRERNIFDRARKINWKDIDKSHLDKLTGSFMKHLVAPILGGVTAGSYIGHPILGSLAGAALGGMVLPRIERRGAGRLVKDLFAIPRKTNGISKVSRALTSPIAQKAGGITGSTLTGGNQ